MSAIMAPPNPDELLVDDLPDDYEEIIASYPAQDDELDVPLSWRLPGKWVHDAACNPVSAPLFWPEHGPPEKYVKNLCKFFCKVRKECLDYAIEYDEREGVWGGMIPVERKRERERRKQGGPPGRAVA